MLINLMLCLLIVGAYSQNYSAYQIPKPDILVKQKGFQVSIPGDPNIKLFAFNGKINEQFTGSEPGHFSGEILTSTGDKFVYENERAILQIGDILYYWIYVQYGNLGYKMERQEYKVTASSFLTNDEVPNRTPVPIEPLSLPTCDISITTVKGRQVCSGELVFEETFSESLAKWTREVKFPSDAEDAEFVVYQNHPELCYIRNGKLVFEPKLTIEIEGFSNNRISRGTLNLGTSCTSTDCRRSAGFSTILPPITTCQLTTKNDFRFKYGKVEIRAKFPKGDWLFPQLYLDPSEKFYGSLGYASGQIRIGFIRGNEHLEKSDRTQINGKLLMGGVVLKPGETYRDLWMKSNSLATNHLGDDFHIYELNWSDESIVLNIDGKRYANIPGNFRDDALQNNITQTNWFSGGKIAPFDREFYITLGLAAGGMSDFPDDCRTGKPISVPKPWENNHPKAEKNFWRKRDEWYSTWSTETSKLEIDYVKVWAL